MDLLFFSFALKNVFRNKWRSTFIIILLTIGILALFASITSGEIGGNLVDKAINASMNNSFESQNYSALMENYSNLDDSSSLDNMSDEDLQNMGIDKNNLAHMNGSNSLNNSKFNMSDLENQKDEMTKGIKSFFFYMTLFLVLIGSIVIMIAMLKSVGERTREIGVLKSIGWTNFRVSGLIILESVFQLLIAWVIVLIILLILYLYNGSAIQETFVNTLHMNMIVFQRIFALTFLASLFVPLIGIIIPLLKAFRIKPSEAMRYE
ncbi:MAG: ABC transporter permease [Methanobrevibacter sp.]|jgi:putative ABC transport system permease protein|nr:ABC transporter permease [Candidatus Methanovirga procula]